ncbi:MAG: tryptophan synthase subunit alpha [Bacteroidales bacterium]|nr:tryptophan synthase subunit alpha [Bacteroidales bacterium]
MNRIDKLFGSNPQRLLSIYFCAGAPTLEGTADVIRTLEKNGVNMIEVGMPFSDPMADGPVIQDAATKALKNGMSLKKLFSQLKDIRKDVNIPLILMGYLNPVFQYGFENFCISCKEVGVDGMIIPDLPFRDYQEIYKPIADKYDLKFVFLITPETSEERIRLIDENTSGFVYMVSSASTTGAQKDFNEAKQAYFKKIEDMNLRIPRVVGFGISNKQTYDAACAHSSGGIVGSRFVTLLDKASSEGLSPEEATDKAIKQLKSDLGL